MLLEKTTRNGNAPQDVVFAIRQYTDDPSQHAQIFGNRLIDAIEIVPDARILGIAPLHRLDVAALDRPDEALGKRQYAAFRIGHSVPPRRYSYSRNEPVSRPDSRRVGKEGVSKCR